MTKICIFGAGAIGGHLGVKLAAAGQAEVSFIARGPHLAAMRAKGVRLTSTIAPEIHAEIFCTDKAEDAGPQDYVFLTLKAHSLLNAVPQIRPLLSPHTAIVAAINGIPWWYFYKLSGAYQDRRLQTIDPTGEIWDALHPARAIGCIVYPAAEVIEPGVIHHTYGDRYSLGEPDGSRSARVTQLSEVMIRAGLKAPVRARIRDELWVKLWGNLSFNPICALTGATLAELLGNTETRDLVRTMMTEAQGAAEAIGIRFAVDIEKRIDGGAEVGAHKPSMLQDLERGRPMEIDALLGSVVEIGAMVGADMPACKIVLALIRQRATLAGCYPA